MLRRVRIEKFASTGEGLSRGVDGVGFIEKALPGEEVDARVRQVRRTFWRGTTVNVLAPAPGRVSGVHAESCPSCDWSHLEAEAARNAKRALFQESLWRIGRIAPEALEPLPVAASLDRYRLRNRFHVAGSGDSTLLGAFARRTHRVEQLEDCEAISRETVGILPALAGAIASSGCSVAEVSLLEDRSAKRRLAMATLSGAPAEGAAGLLADRASRVLEGVRVRSRAGATVAARGSAFLEIPVGGRQVAVAPDSFFQTNRHLLDALAAEVRESAAISPGEALDAFGGVGFFAGPLLDGGHRVTTVEGSPVSAALARRNRTAWGADGSWGVTESSLEQFLVRQGRPYDFVLVDPPRTGLPSGFARALASLAARRFVYVSCEPATLARDLREILPEGFAIARVRLFDLFALTHRIEAVVTLDRIAPA